MPLKQQLKMWTNACPSTCTQASALGGQNTTFAVQGQLPGILRLLLLGK